MINIKKFLKGLRIINDKDQTKSLEFSVPDSVTTGTKTTVVPSQTTNVTITLPNATTTLSGNDTPADLTNKTISLSNTTDNKLLMSEATTHKVIDSLITQIDNAGDAQLSVPNNISITVPSTNEIILAGKAVRLPIATFPAMSPPTGNVGDIVYNTTTQSIWLYQSGGYVELISGSGASRTLSNLLSPVAANQDINPDTNGRDLGTDPLRWDLYSDIADINTLTVNTQLTLDADAQFNQDVIIDGDLTVNGTTTTLNTQTLDVEDANITINNGGSDVSAQNAGITIDRTSTSGSLVFDDTLPSYFKSGLLGSESEILTAATAQTLTGIKTFNALLNLGRSDDSTINTYLDFASSPPTKVILTNRATITELRNLTLGASGFIINESAGDITFVHNVGIPDGIDCADKANYILAPGEGFLYTKLVSGYTKIFPITQKFTEETHTFTLNGSYYDPTDTFPIAAIDGLFVMPYNAMITNVFMYNLVAGDGGQSRLRLSSRPFGSPTYTNLFTQDPRITFSAGNDVAVGVGDIVTGTTAPILNISAQLILAKSILKCDVIQLQSGTTVLPEDCGLIVHYIKL